MVGDNVLEPPTKKLFYGRWWCAGCASGSRSMMADRTCIKFNQNNFRNNFNWTSTHDSLLKAAMISIPDNPQSSTLHPLTKFSLSNISTTYPRLCSTTTKNLPQTLLGQIPFPSCSKGCWGRSPFQVLCPVSFLASALIDSKMDRAVRYIPI